MLSTKMLLYSGNNPVNYAQSIQQGRPIRLEYLIFAISPVGGLCVYFNGQDEQSSKVFLPDFLTKLKEHDHHWFFSLSNF